MTRPSFWPDLSGHRWTEIHFALTVKPSLNLLSFDSNLQISLPRQSDRSEQLLSIFWVGHETYSRLTLRQGSLADVQHAPVLLPI